MSSSLLEKLKIYLKKDAKFTAVYQKVKDDFLKADLPAHNWEHVYRDIINAIIIGESEKADMQIVLPAITLHDIGFLYDGTGKTHAAIGADKLQEYLNQANILYANDSLTHIADCIRTHKGSMHHEKPKTLEAKVVADADMLEKFGPVGLFQTIKTYAEFRIPIEEAIERLRIIKDLQLETTTGEQLVKAKREFINNFLIGFEKSYNVYK